MSRRSLLIVTLVLVALSAVAIRHAWGQRAQRKREAAYQSALQSYSEALKLGIARKSLEDYLRTKGTAFQQMCCIDERSAFAALVEIGKEKHPWYCNEHNVYIAFQFVAVEPHDVFRAYDSDVLKRVTIFHWLEGCL
jgi:hypothetical protein